ncbi:MAG TPA: hypothetical protein VIL84_15630 [Devosiaceae bacterium]
MTVSNPSIVPDSNSVWIERHKDDPIVQGESVDWALERLTTAVRTAGAVVAECRLPESHVIQLGGPSYAASAGKEGPRLPESSESLLLYSPSPNETVAIGRDSRGLVHAILELVDRLATGNTWHEALVINHPVAQSPALEIRSIARPFSSDVEDLPWFRSKEFWDAYLDVLAESRFNRVCFLTGLQYNYPYHRQNSDVYFYLAYPYLVDLPEFGVSIRNFPDAERQQNLESLRYAAKAAHRRGLHFQLGLWTQAYDFKTPHANWFVEGITQENHAAYCRAAVVRLLVEVPEIDGLTFRVHIEGGVEEGNVDFWREMFEGIASVGRPVSVDLHAKGIDAEILDAAQAAGLEVTLSPKYTGEHMGLPYHQAAVRELERPPENESKALFRFSEGSRKFLRYSYGDLLKHDRSYKVMFRIWPGTQRHLVWGDPVLAAGYGRQGSIAGANGIEWCEPLSFKGRMGTGLGLGRSGYSAEALRTAFDFDKFRYTYRVWGRRLYDPDEAPEATRRHLSRSCAPSDVVRVEGALAHASRILLLLTTAHSPSPCNNTFWPELYLNMSIVRKAPPLPYGYDTADPKTFNGAGALDPQLFMGIDEFVKWLEGPKTSPRYTPSDVAEWLQREADAALSSVRSAERPDWSAEQTRLLIDAEILGHLGRFFAAKIRAGIAWSVLERAGDREAGEKAVAHYRTARDAWKAASDTARVYHFDLTYGMEQWLRGHWQDRLFAIDDDIEELQRRLRSILPSEQRSATGGLLTLAQDYRTARIDGWEHSVPAGYTAGDDLRLDFRLPGAVRAATLRYRALNQAERWQEASVDLKDGGAQSIVPGRYLTGIYPLQYYLELQTARGGSLAPGLDADLANSPYWIVSRVSRGPE